MKPNLTILPTVEPKPQSKTPVTEESFHEVISRLAENGWQVTVAHGAIGRWRCEIRWPYRAEMLTAEQRKDFYLLIADSGYGHETPIDALRAAGKQHQEKLARWQAKYAEPEQWRPKLGLAG